MDEEFEAKPKTKSLKSHTLAQLQAMPDAEVLERLTVELHKQKIHIESLYGATRNTVVMDRLREDFGVESLEQNGQNFWAMLPSQESVKVGEYVDCVAYRALLICLWRKAKEPKQSKRKQLTDYSLEELLALPPGDIMDDLLNEQVYGGLGGGTCKRSTSNEIVGQNLEKLDNLVGTHTQWHFLGEDEKTWGLDWPESEFVVRSNHSRAHCVATALLVAYWFKSKSEEGVGDAST